MEIKSLEKTDFDTLFRAFDRAFADYEVRIDKEGLRAMFKRRGFDPGLSFAAFDGQEIAAFTLNGIGNFNGLPTAYDTGTGTLEAYRGKGLATGIFEFSIPHLKRAGIAQYLLEVLQHNTKAVSVYRKLGFETAREFNYSHQQNSAVVLGDKSPDIPCSIRRIAPCEIVPLAGFRDFHPSWQNSVDSIARAAESLVCLGAFSDGRPVGYGVFEPASGDIAQLAVDRPYRRHGIATALLREMVGMNGADAVKAINTDVRCESANAFLLARNIAVRGRQFEMIREI